MQLSILEKCGSKKPNDFSIDTLQSMPLNDVNPWHNRWRKVPSSLFHLIAYIHQLLAY